VLAAHQDRLARRETCCRRVGGACVSWTIQRPPRNHRAPGVDHGASGKATTPPPPCVARACPGQQHPCARRFDHVNKLLIRVRFIPCDCVVNWTRQNNPKLSMQRTLGGTFWNAREDYVPEPPIQSNRYGPRRNNTGMLSPLSCLPASLDPHEPAGSCMQPESGTKILAPSATRVPRQTCLLSFPNPCLARCIR